MDKMVEKEIPNIQSSGGRKGLVVEGDTLQLLFEIHTVAIFKGFNWRSRSFAIPWWCRWPHNFISSKWEMMSKLMREELWEEWMDPIVGIVAEIRQGFKAIKIQSLCDRN